MDESFSSIRPADLRGILNYVPRFLGQTFVIALDGAIVEDKNLPNILLDIAVLRSLQINIVIAHGIGKQIQELSESRGIPITNSDGNGPTDQATLDLGIRASSRVSHQILEGLTQAGLKCAITNSVRAMPVGIIKGADQQLTGKAERIDAEFLKHLIAQNIVPIVQPIGFDRNGKTLRINSDALAMDVAFALKATKVIYLTETKGLVIDDELKRQIPVNELEAILSSESASQLPRGIVSKAQQALKGVKGEVSRAHIIDGREHDGLISEVFSNEGVGTLIYGNAYASIRQARPDEAPLIYHLIRSAIDKEQLARRDINSIESASNDFYVYEIDGNLIGCVVLNTFADAPETIELGSLFVHRLYQGQGIGRKLIDFACLKAAEKGAKQALALSTQSYDFFKSVCGFTETDIDSLPPSRRASYSASNRQSRILIKRLG